MQNKNISNIRLQLMNVHSGQDGRYTFVRIPKTGSLSMNTALWNATEFAKSWRKNNNKNTWLQAPKANLWWDHYTAGFCLDTLGEAIWNESINFSVVRNPWARLYSLWKYNEEVSAKITFQDWIMSKCPYPRLPHHKLTEPEDFCSQLDWLTDENGNIIVNFICRLEELTSVGEPVFKSIVGNDFKIPPVKKNKTSEPGEYKLHYNSEMIELVATLCKKDIELFHYTFDGFEEPGWFYWSE